MTRGRPMLANNQTQSLGNNPIFAPWQGPYGGVPPFDRVKVEDLEPALRAAMIEALTEIDRIAINPDPPTFRSTLEALEKTGRTLNRVIAAYRIFTSSLSNEPIRELEARMNPLLSEHRDRIVLNEKLFARIQTVYEARESLHLSPEQQRLLWLTYTDFVRAGARLSPDAKRELVEINKQLATLFARFSQNVLKAEDEYILLADPKQVDGLPDAVKDGMARAARSRGFADAWAVSNTRSVVEPFLTFSPHRELRKEVFDMFVKRSDGGPADNNPVIPEIVQLRDRRAKLLGYQSHAHLRLENTMARTPERAMKLLEDVWKPAVARVKEEVAELQVIADKDDSGVTIEPWDYRYYQEKLRAEKYDLKDSEIAPYLQVEKLRDGMFYVAQQLFDLQFRAVSSTSASVYHPNVEVFEVCGADGKHVGLLYFDPFNHEGKRSGAWMAEIRSQECIDGAVTPIVTNNCNFVQASPGRPSLLSWTDATTLFHEFGHALHGLCSKVSYPSLAGTNVSRDFVELPSQLFERWLETPEVLSRFAVHCDTGEPMPSELVKKIQRAITFDAGFTTVEALACAFADMQIHLAGHIDRDPRLLEKEILEQLAMPREVAMRHRLPHFLHMFSSDEYSAGYYSYLWADTLAADAWEAFLEANGPWDRDVAKALCNTVLSAGNTQAPDRAYRAFRGRDVGIQALLRKRGFPAG
jgi:peptidyl-dipeptidase Dcp